MRPLRRTGPPDEAETQPAYALLINAFGPYCAISEEPLYDVAYVWDKATNTEFPANQPPAQNWSNLLLLSAATCDAWRRHHPLPGSQLLLPDRDATFQLEGSPFVYALEPIKVTYTDASDRELSESGVEELVIIEGTTATAQATIETFSLNTEYFDPETKELRIPKDDYLSRQDGIIRSRTQAWRRAIAAADQIEAFESDQRRAFSGQLRISAVATGHWSVWATVFWSRFRDSAFVASALGSRPDLAGFAPQNEFPGTASTWLVGARNAAMLRFEIRSLDSTKPTLDFVPEAEALLPELETLLTAQYAGSTVEIQRVAALPVNPEVQELIVSARWGQVGKEASAAFADTVRTELLKLFQAKLRNLSVKLLQVEIPQRSKSDTEGKDRSSKRKRNT
jgi:hypothetical protein